jgi:hypothetical protein
MVDFIADKLICFQVPDSFALQVANYIKSKVSNQSSDFNVRSSWLFFTSGIEYAPNWNSVIADITNTRSDYLPLWNGKSSFFRINLDTSGFDFGKTSLEADSKEVLYITSQSIKKFSPAKAVPDVLARSSYNDAYPVVPDSRFPTVSVPKADYAHLRSTSGAALAGFAASALAMSSYKRGLTATSVNTFSRQSVNSIVDTLLNPTGATAILPRRNHRRRDLKHLIPREGYYDRSGFNSPSPMHNYITSGPLVGNYLPLGLIPSSLEFVKITDYYNIPAIYSKCEDLSSSNTYNGVAVSNTFPIRGWVPN